MTEVTHIEVDAGVRYWEDASVNGVYEADGAPTIHGASGESWKVRIRLIDGYVEGWPEGTTANVHYKVCDAGEYWLTDASEKRIAKWNGSYVPSDFLCHGDSGWGDYIIMSIDGAGLIAGYEVPQISESEWDRIDKPSPLRIADAPDA